VNWRGRQRLFRFTIFWEEVIQIIKEAWAESIMIVQEGIEPKWR
jgi:hypothetical protein